MSLANFIKSAATQLDEVATWLLGKISSHLISLSSGSIIPANCICLAGAYLQPALSCLPLALSASTSFPATSLLLSLSLSFCFCFCLSTSASKLVINQLVASLTSCRIIFSRCKLTLHTHTHIAEASSCQCLGLSLVCCARFSTHHFLCWGVEHTQKEFPLFSPRHW